MNDNALLVNALGTVVVTLLGQGFLTYNGRRNNLHKILASSYGLLSMPLAVIGILYIAQKLETGVYQGPDPGILSSSAGPLAFSLVGFMVLIVLFVNNIRAVLLASAFVISLGLLGSLVVAEFFSRYLSYGAFLLFTPMAAIGVVAVTKKINKEVLTLKGLTRPISVVSAPRPVTAAPAPSSVDSSLAATEFKPFHATGELLNKRFQQINVMAEGGMATIIKALDTQTGKEVCIKTNRIGGPNPDQYCLDKIRYEIEILRNCNHPNIVKYVDQFEIATNGNVKSYLVIEFIPGKNLRELFITNRAAEAQVRKWSLQLLSALDYLHKTGYIHRDINPKNILLKNDDIVLIDFGIGSKVKPGEIQTAVGTEGYAPYEQKEAKEPHADVRSDIFSLAATMYFLLQGHPPNTLDIHYGRITSMLEKTGVTPQLANIVGKSLNLDPTKRFQSAMEMGQALQGI